MHDRFELGYTFSSTQAASLVKSVPFGHISEADVAAMKSTTKDTKTKAHPQIPDLHPRANWFPNAAGRITLRHFDHAVYALNRPVHAECLIFWFRLVRWALTAWCDGTKWLEVRKLHLLPKNFAPGCVITLDALGNCVVDQDVQVGGLKDLQALCVCGKDPTGTKLLPTGIPEKYFEKGSSNAENLLFGYADLNNKRIVVFTVKWPKRS